MEFYVRKMRAMLALLSGLFGSTTHAQSIDFSKSRDNLMVVVREYFGENRDEDSFKATGKQKFTLKDGKEVEVDFAHWQFIGDTHIRFVFDSPKVMGNATREDLANLGLGDVEAALKVSTENIHRVYGRPGVTPFQNGMFQVQGKSPDIDSSYFLDRDFWKALLEKNPDGLLVAVPKRGGMIYAPLSDKNAVDILSKSVTYLHQSSERLRVSGALFQFKEGRWSVMRASQAK
jgi:hypothetical protein